MPACAFAAGVNKHKRNKLLGMWLGTCLCVSLPAERSLVRRVGGTGMLWVYK